MDAIEKILREAAALSSRDRGLLARRLRRSVNNELPPKLAAELKQRLEEIESGRATLLSSEEVEARLRAEFGFEPSGEQRPAKISELDRWIADNNPPRDLEYAGAFWHHVELMQSLIAKFEGTDERVVGAYVVDTPPPEEKLTMPAVAFEIRGVTFAIKWDFGALARWPCEWTVSVKRRSPYLGPTLQLFDEATDLSNKPIEGFGPELTFPPFRMNRSAFTCELVDEFDVVTLIQLVSFEA